MEIFITNVHIDFCKYRILQVARHAMDLKFMTDKTLAK